MPSCWWSREHKAWIKECIKCKEVFVGTSDYQQSLIVLGKNFSVGGASNLDGLYTSCNLCIANKKYGYQLTHQQKKELYQQQNGKCPICTKPLAYNDVKVDHCHKTGVVRGLLHTPCNSQLGFYENHLARIKAYLGDK